MTSFIDIPIETDAGSVEQDVYDALAERFPGWEPSPSQLEVFLVKALSLMSADLAEVSNDVPGDIFAQFGTQIVNVPPFLAISASSASTWTMTDDAGYTIPAGTQVAIPAAGDEDVAFVVLADVTVAPGDTATAAGEVILSAIEPGVGANDLDATPVLIDALAFVDSIALIAPTAGGQDAEEDDAYLDRLAAEMTLLTPRPILPPDVEILARRIPEVIRALALDGYNPDDDTYDNERMLAVAVVDEDGEVVSSDGKDAVDVLLQAMREVNFVFNVIDPTYTTIDVDVAATALPGFDTSTVEAAIDETISDLLLPANWGRGQELQSAFWRLQDTVRRNELIAVANRVEGVDYVSALTLAIHGDSLATADVTLSGPAPLTRPGDVTSTVSAP
jgi:hypothetical protein